MAAVDLKNHFCLQNTDTLRAINKPLQLLDVDAFCFTSINLKTGDRYLLTDHPKWTHYAYNSDFYDIEMVKKIETTGFLDSFLWSELSHDKYYAEKLRLASEFGLNHGITFIEHNADKVNIYYAATSNATLNSQYMVDISEQLMNFIPYFHHAARDLIKESTQNQFSVRGQLPNKLLTLDQRIVALFNEAIEIKKLVINEQGDYLTHQEALCAYYLLQGKQIKFIAEKQGLSARTIEKHIANIRKKLKLITNESLNEYFFDSIYLKHIIFYGKRYAS